MVTRTHAVRREIASSDTPIGANDDLESELAHRASVYGTAIVEVISRVRGPRIN